MLGFVGNLKQKWENLMLAPGSHDHDDYDDDYYDEEEDEGYSAPEPPRATRTQVRHAQAQKSFRDSAKAIYDDMDAPALSPLPGTGNIKSTGTVGETIVAFAHPENMKDAQAICVQLQQGRAVIVDLSSASPPRQQRIADYITGVCNALSGEIRRLNNGIFAAAPKGVRIVDLLSEGSLRDGDSLYTNFSIAR